ncbi:peptidase M60-like family [Carp edema virus]|nr:peptidase M60-like family [Carp edema virus]
MSEITLLSKNNTEQIFALTTTSADLEAYVTDLKGNIFVGRLINSPWTQIKSHIVLYPQGMIRSANQSTMNTFGMDKSSSWVIDTDLKNYFAGFKNFSTFKFDKNLLMSSDSVVLTVQTLNDIATSYADLKTFLSNKKVVFLITPNDASLLNELPRGDKPTLLNIFNRMNKTKNETAVAHASSNSAVSTYDSRSVTEESTTKKMSEQSQKFRNALSKFTKFLNIPSIVLPTNEIDNSNFFTFTINSLLGVLGVHITNITETSKLIDSRMKSSVQLAYTRNLKEDYADIFGSEPIQLQNATASSVIPIGKYNFGMVSKDEKFVTGWGVSMGMVGNGMVVVFGHEGLMNNSVLDTMTKNLTAYAQGRPGPKPANVFQKYTMYSINDSNSQDILNFISEGGIAYIGGHNWYYAQTGGNMDKWVQNKLLMQLGFYMTPSTSETTPIRNPLAIQNYYCVSDYLLDFILKYNTKQISPKSLDAQYTMPFMVGLDNFWRSPYYEQEQKLTVNLVTGFFTLITDKLKGNQEVYISNAEQFQLISMAEKIWYYKKHDKEIIANVFEPNYIAKNLYKAPDGTYSKEIHRSALGGDWVSTGAYLVPGTRCTIKLSKALTIGVRFRVGSQSDSVSGGFPMRRAPWVVRESYLPAGATSIEIDNFWGGVVYFIPDGTYDVSTKLVLSFSNCIQYFHYHEGLDLDKCWALLRNGNKLPYFAEMEGKKLIVAGPVMTIYDFCKKKEDIPVSTNRMNIMMDEYVWLRAEDYWRPERVQLDWKISAGWMHSGYPVAGFTVSSYECFYAIATKSPIWGIYHELGHNSQRGPWEFSPKTTESQCNIFSAYMLDFTETGITQGYYSNADQSKRIFLSRQLNGWEGIRKANNNNPTFAHWDDQYPLATFVLLMTEFGWKCGRNFFSYYYRGNNWPGDWTEKQQVMIKHMSEACNKNLVDYYDYWGFDVSQATRDFCAKYGAPWMFDLDKYTNLNSPKWNFVFSKI